MRVLLVRHGETDWASMDARGLRGAANDLAGLTARGVHEAQRVARELAGEPVTRLVSSPMTRALQTAAVLAAELGLAPDVDHDLREWLVDDTYRWDASTAPRVFAEFDALGGEWPPGQRRGWEPLSTVRRRASAALDRTVDPGRGLSVVVTHGIVIRALTGRTGVATGAVVEHHTPQRQ